MNKYLKSNCFYEANAPHNPSDIPQAQLGGSSSKRYVALLTNDGSGNVTANVLVNTLNANLVFHSDGAGYQYTSGFAFDKTKTIVRSFANNFWNGNIDYSIAGIAPTNQGAPYGNSSFLYLVTKSANLGIDNWGDTITLEIEVFE